MFTSATNLASGVPITDSQSGFRAFSPAALTKMRLSSDGFSVESEMQLLAQQHGLRVTEIPITANYEEPPKRPLWVHGMLVLNGFLRVVGQTRPLLFFGVPGAVLLIAGLLWGLWVVNIYRSTQELAVGYALVSLLLTVLGALALFSGVILHSIRGLLLSLLKPDREP